VTEAIHNDVVNGDAIGLNASLNDLAAGNISYTIVDSNGDEVINGAYSIDANTGIVTVNDSSQIDFVNDTTNNITIKRSLADDSASIQNYKVSIDDTQSAVLIDGVVEGVFYQSSSGVTGFTDSNGSYNFKSGDDVTFSIGNVVLGTATAEDIINGQTFLQDIADVARTNLNDEYLENMAVFLQSLDSDLVSDHIVISEHTHQLLSDKSIDLRTASEEQVKDLVESAGGTYVTEDAALEHVQDILEDYTDMQESDFDEHISDSEAQSQNSILQGHENLPLVYDSEAHYNILHDSDHDIFHWNEDSLGVVGEPTVDTVVNFHQEQHDVLDLSDLLHHPSGNSEDLSHYLHFEQEGDTTKILVNTHGDFNEVTGLDAAHSDQVIELQHTNLINGHSNDIDIIQELLDNSMLITDV